MNGIAANATQDIYLATLIGTPAHIRNYPISQKHPAMMDFFRILNNHSLQPC